MRIGVVFSCLVCLALTARASASDPGSSVDNSNPYSVIVERNVFHLNPPPPPPAPDLPKPDLPVIKLSGFLKIGNGPTHVLFSSVPKDKKDLPTYYNLAEGEKQGILEVVKIHEEAGTVDILNSGTPATLSLKDDTLAANNAPVNTSAHKEQRPFDRFRSRPWEQPGGRPNMPFPFPMRPTRMPMPR